MAYVTSVYSLALSNKGSLLVLADKAVLIRGASISSTSSILAERLSTSGRKSGVSMVVDCVWDKAMEIFGDARMLDATSRSSGESGGGSAEVGRPIRSPGASISFVTVTTLLLFHLCLSHTYASPHKDILP